MRDIPQVPWRSRRSVRAIPACDLGGVARLWVRLPRDHENALDVRATDADLARPCPVDLARTPRLGHTNQVAWRELAPARRPERADEVAIGLPDLR